MVERSMACHVAIPALYNCVLKCLIIWKVIMLNIHQGLRNNNIVVDIIFLATKSKRFFPSFISKSITRKSVEKVKKQSEVVV